MPSQSLRASPEGIAKAQKALIRYSLTHSSLADALEVTRLPISNFFRGRKVSLSIFIKICTELKLNWEEVVATFSDNLESDTASKNFRNATSLGRSLELSSEGIFVAQRALRYRALTQKALAEDMGISRPTIVNFFGGKPVDRNYFIQICERLNLEWEDVVKQLVEQDISSNIDALVQEVREDIKPYIQERCGTMRVLDMTQPIGLNDIYTNVNILENITGRRRREISELWQNFKIESDDFDRLGLGMVREKRIPGLKAVERYSKLMVLGKPGAGKTTFLKYLAIQGISGQFQINLVPIFITLKELAESANEPDLLKFIIQFLSNSNKISTQIVMELLNSGRLLILLDSLDEVRVEDHQRIIREIKEFSNKYSINHFVLTNRIAAHDYTFEHFTEVELADFDEMQIEIFVNKWFLNKGFVKASERFMQQLKSNQQIKELANNPLLLTLLCLEFEDSGDFPSDRAELYNRAIHTLLTKWDASRGITRDNLYRNLSVRNKENLLTQLGWATFERNEYFFKQRDIERYIAQYISNLPEAKTDLEALYLDSEMVLKSIEAQHGLLVERAKGIYSFSHLTIQEYFTARKIVYSSYQQELLKTLVSHITEKRWRDIFLLTASMLENADYFLILMKHQIDAILEKDTKLQAILTWVREKSYSIEVFHKQAAIRAFYLELELGHFYNSAIERVLSHALGRERSSHSLDLDLFLSDSLNLTLDLSRAVERERALSLSFDLSRSLERSCNLSRGLMLQHELQTLKNQLPDRPQENSEKFKQWWQTDCQAWTEQLKSKIIEHRNIGHDWQFSYFQKELLKQYYDANKLLIDCLNSDCYVSRKVRQEIEDTLLLPII